MAVTQANILATLVGVVGALVAGRIGTLVGAVVLRVRVHNVVIGLGPRVLQWGRIVVRALPVTMTINVLQTRPRYVGTAVASVLFGAAAVAGFVAYDVDLALGGGAVLL